MAGDKRPELVEPPTPEGHEGSDVDSLEVELIDAAEAVFLALEDDEVGLEEVEDYDVRRIPLREYLLFDNPWQLRRWRMFLAELRRRYPDAAHNGERVVKYLNEMHGSIDENIRPDRRAD